MTVKELLEQLRDLPEDGIIFVARSGAYNEAAAVETFHEPSGESRVYICDETSREENL